MFGLSEGGGGGGLRQGLVAVIVGGWIGKSRLTLPNREEPRQPGRFVFALSASQPGIWSHAKPLHARSAGKHLCWAHLVQLFDVGLRQSHAHSRFEQLASDTQHGAHDSEKPRLCTHDSIQGLPETMHRTAQP